MMVNYFYMTVNYLDILTLEIIGFFTAVIYHGKLLQYFIALAPGFISVSNFGTVFKILHYHRDLRWAQ